MLTAHELHLRGVGAVNVGRVRQARELFERARARTTDPAMLARIDTSAAYVALELGDADAAEELCRSALGSAGTRPDRGVTLSQLAMVHMRRGEPGPALSLFTRGIELLGSSPNDLAKAHGNRGDVFLHQGQAAAAAGDFEVAARIFGELGADIEQAKAEHNLGYAKYLQGDLVGAIAEMTAAARVLDDVSPVVGAICQQDRAEVFIRAGLVREGVELLTSSARRYGSRRLRQRQAEAELAIARSILQHDPARARAAAVRACGRFRLLGADAWRVRADAVVVAADLALRRPVSEALIADVAEALERQGLRWEAVALRLRSGRTTRTSAPRVAPLAVRLLDREVRADLAEQAGRRSEALRHLRVGLADLHAWQSSFGSLDLQTGVAAHGIRLGVRGLGLAVGSRRPAVLLEWSERARMLASRVQPVRPPEDATIAADLAELRAEPTPGREAELRRRIRERAWQHRGSGEVADQVTLAVLESSLDADTALVVYVVTAAEIVALVVSGSGTTWLDLGSRTVLNDLLGGLLPDLDIAAADLPGPMAGAVRGSLSDRLRRLAELLVTPTLEAMGDRRVVLTPSGVLAGVPWTLLPGYVGRPVTVAQSATSWLARRATPLRTASAGFVAGPRVVRAADEVNAAAKEWPSARVLVGEAATASAVSELAEQVDVLHVAAHGRHSSENPLFSGLQLADGPWFGYDVDRLRAVPDVVLLSACEVGRSTVRWGEELIGMSAAWLHAGARCVIASPAAVNDAAAYDVLVAVHERLAAGIDPAAALASAVPAVSADTAPVPLVCFG